MLLLHANRPVSADSLAEAIWDGVPPATAKASLQNHVMRLRRALGRAGSPVLTRAPGYLIEVRDGELDLDRFTRLRESGRAAARDGSWAVAADLLGSALSQWTGEPISNVRSSYPLSGQARRLTELRLETTELRLEAELHLGHHAVVVGEFPCAGRHPSAARAVPRAADVRAVRRRAPGRGAGRLSGTAADAGRGVRYRAGPPDPAAASADARGRSGAHCGLAPRVRPSYPPARSGRAPPAATGRQSFCRARRRTNPAQQLVRPRRLRRADRSDLRRGGCGQDNARGALGPPDRRLISWRPAISGPARLLPGRSARRPG